MLVTFTLHLLYMTTSRGKPVKVNIYIFTFFSHKPPQFISAESALSGHHPITQVIRVYDLDFEGVRVLSV
jgi:hypothetical protein